MKQQSMEKMDIDCLAMSVKLYRHDPIESDKGSLLHVLAWSLGADGNLSAIQFPTAERVPEGVGDAL